MPTVDLGTVWLNAAADLSDNVAFTTMASLSFTKDQDGEVRRMANGRLRVVRRAGSIRTLSVEIAAATRAEVDWLEEHVGDLVCVRDDRGRKFYGVYMGVAVDEIRGNDYGNTSITLTEVTHSEAV